jgi:hypothetical protein
MTDVRSVSSRIINELRIADDIMWDRYLDSKFLREKKLTRWFKVWNCPIHRINQLVCINLKKECDEKH